MSEQKNNEILQSARPKDDYSAIRGLAATIPGCDIPNAPKAPLTRQERRRAKREFKTLLRKAKKGTKVQVLDENIAEAGYSPTKAKSIQKQLRERDKELERNNKLKRIKRRNARNVIDFLGYEYMFQNGICEVEEGLFSETLSFNDISYQSARDDRQLDIHSVWSRMYNYFGSHMTVQLTITNTPVLKETLGKRKFFDEEMQPNDNARQAAETFNRVLNDKMREGVSNIKRDRYLTYSIPSDSIDTAVHSLARIRSDVQTELKKIDCDARQQSGQERLQVLHSMLQPGKPFLFDYDKDIHTKSVLTTKDHIAPMSINFKPQGDSSCFLLDKTWAQVLVLKDFGSEISDRALSDIVDLPIPMVVSLFAHPVDKAKAREDLRRTDAWIDKEIIDNQRHAVSKGYDFSLIPSNLQQQKDDSREMLEAIESKNERLFTMSVLIYTYADTKRELDERVIQIISTARRNSLEIETLDYRQREGLNSVMPLGNNHIAVRRTATTAQVAMLTPFATQELDMEGGIYVGQNANSNNLVLCNRKLLSSPVGFICGKTGSGKSFYVKQEIMGTFLKNPKDQFILFDRAGEYRMLTHFLKGTEIKFAVDSGTYLNPFDLSNLSDKSREAQVAFKIDAMLAQAAASASEANQPLPEEEQSIIAYATECAFEAARKDGRDAPILGDFHKILLNDPDINAKELSNKIALRYQRFVSGSHSFFNRNSNVNWGNRIIDLNIKELPDSMLVFALINLCEATRNQMYANFDRGIRTWIYIEEIQSLFRHKTILNYFSRFAAESRKFGGLLTGITQNSVAMLDSEEARAIVLNADNITLLKQSAVDRLLWTDLLALSAQEAGCIDETADKGAGLVIAGAARVPIKGGFPRGNKLYEVFSTDPNDVENAVA